MRSHRIVSFFRCRSLRPFVVAVSLSCDRLSAWHNSTDSLFRFDDVIHTMLGNFTSLRKDTALSSCQCLSGVSDIVPVSALCLLRKSPKCRTAKRSDLGEYHRLFQELRLDAVQFDELLARIGGRIAGWMPTTGQLHPTCRSPGYLCPMSGCFVVVYNNDIT